MFSRIAIVSTIGICCMAQEPLVNLGPKFSSPLRILYARVDASKKLEPVIIGTSCKWSRQAPNFVKNPWRIEFIRKDGSTVKGNVYNNISNVLMTWVEVHTDFIGYRLFLDGYFFGEQFIIPTYSNITPTINSEENSINIKTESSSSGINIAISYDNGESWTALEDPNEKTVFTDNKININKKIHSTQKENIILEFMQVNGLTVVIKRFKLP